MDESPSAPDPGSPLSFAKLLIFSTATVPTQALLTVISVYLPAYFAASIGVPLTAVAGVFAICRAIDIPLGPALGAVMDRTRSTVGRYRLWLLIGAPAISLGIIMLLRAHQGVGNGFLIAWILMMQLGLSIMMLSHSAWTGRIARTYEQRSRLFAFTMCFGAVGVLVVMMLPIVMSRHGYSDSDGVRAMCWFIVAAAPVTAGLVAIFTPEKMVEDAPRHGEFRARDYFELIARPSMARVLAADPCFVLAPSWMSVIAVFFARDRLGLGLAQTNILLFGSILAGVIGTQVAGILGARIGKHRAAVVMAAIQIAALISMLAVRYGSLWSAVPSYFFMGFAGLAYVALIRAMVADVADEVRLEQGKERMGILYALVNLTTQMGSAVAIVLVLPLLAHVGYDARTGHHNLPEAIRALTWVYVLGPTAFLSLGSLAMIGYRLTADRTAEIRRLLDQSDTGHVRHAHLDASGGQSSDDPKALLGTP
jgi:Na+/melibiose symporter-like transporter